MDRQVRDLKQWLFRLPQFGSVFLSIFVDDPSCQNQVPVKPGVPKASSVCRDVELLRRFELGLRNRSQAQARTVSVRPDNFEPSLCWLKALSNIKGNQSRVISRKEISWPLFKIPVLRFTQLLITFLIQLLPAPVNNVERWSWYIYEIKKSLG